MPIITKENECYSLCVCFLRSQNRPGVERYFLLAKFTQRTTPRVIKWCEGGSGMIAIPHGLCRPVIKEAFSTCPEVVYSPIIFPPAPPKLFAQNRFPFPSNAMPLPVL